MKHKYINISSDGKIIKINRKIIYIKHHSALVAVKYQTLLKANNDLTEAKAANCINVTYRTPNSCANSTVETNCVNICFQTEIGTRRR